MTTFSEYKTRNFKLDKESSSTRENVKNQDRQGDNYDNKMTFLRGS